MKVLSSFNTLKAVAFLLLWSPFVIAQEANPSALSKTIAGGKNMLAIGKIKAAFADRKDIRGRLIRIHFDGTTLQLAGFAQSTEAAKAAETLSQSIAKPNKVETYWHIDAAVTNCEPYSTYIGEQSEDALIKTRVLASLAAPDVRPQLQSADVHYVAANHGQVSVYIIADAPPAQFDLAPHITPIEGVKSWSLYVLKAYPANASQPESQKAAKP